MKYGASISLMPSLPLETPIKKILGVGLPSGKVHASRISTASDMCPSLLPGNAVNLTREN